MKTLHICLFLVVFGCFAPVLVRADDVPGLVAKAAALEQKVVDLEQKVKDLTEREKELSKTIEEFISKGEVKITNVPTVKVETMPNYIRVRAHNRPIRTGDKIELGGRMFNVIEVYDDGWLDVRDSAVGPSDNSVFWVNLNATPWFKYTPKP